MSGLARRRVLYLVTEDWYFVSHRLPMARAARDAGFEVHVATTVNRHREVIQREGFELHALDWRRGSVDPRDAVGAAARVRAVLRRTAPDLIHNVGVQASVVGSAAALGLDIPSVSGLTGLGFVFTSRTPRARATRAVLAPAMRLLLGRGRSMVLVQNPDDGDAMARLGVDPRRIALIPGSGVDTRRFVPLPEPPGPIAVAYVGRLLEDKGLAALLEAHRLLGDRGVAARLLLAGDADPLNPASCRAADIAAWRRRPDVELLGHVANISDVWARAHVAVLPSRREGLPLSLLEAAACGRPLVATDVPGCREIARHRENALLVPVDDPRALADALAELAEDDDLRRRFGAASRRLVESTFSTDHIGAAIVSLYERALTT